jgi:dolichol-phosphate mannosyltransferase
MNVPLIDIVVPTYNRREMLERLIASLLEQSYAADRYRIIIVDDGSSDATLAAVAARAAEDSRVGAVALSRNFGKEIAIAAGLDHVRGRAVVIMDADLQHPPEVVPRLLAALADGADLAVASRYAAGGDSELGFVRNLFSRACTLLVRLSLGRQFHVSDPLSGFFALRRSVVANSRLAGSGFKILMEVLACGQYREVREVPFRFLQRERGQSKLGLRTALRDLRGLARAAREFRRRK